MKRIFYLTISTMFIATTIVGRTPAAAWGQVIPLTTTVNTAASEASPTQATSQDAASEAQTQSSSQDAASQAPAPSQDSASQAQPQASGPSGIRLIPSTNQDAASTGPAFSCPKPVGTYTPPKEIGPGIPDEEPSETAPLSQTVPLSGAFQGNPIENPIVKPVDKYAYEQMEADMKSLQERYGSKIHVNSIGQSHDGRTLYEIILGNQDAPKHVLLQGGIHGREYMTPLLMMNQIELALANYDTGRYNGRALSEMFQQVALHFVPMVNPDGVAISQFGLGAIRSEALRQGILACYARDLAAGVSNLPLEHYLTRWKSNAMGVDLNHNFPASWEMIQPSATANSCVNYKGAAPLSEPETQALAALSGQRQWAASVSYHSMGNIIYWDTYNNQAAESSLALAQTICQITGYGLDNSKGVGGYKDWMQVNGQMAPAITLEVGSVACPLPFGEYEIAWQRNQAVWGAVMEFALAR